MKEKEEDQEEDQRKKKRLLTNNNNSQMMQQRMLQKLPIKHQGQNSCIFLYRSSQGQHCIFKAAQTDRSNRISSLSNEFKTLSDLDQLSSQENNGANNNNNLIIQNNNNNQIRHNNLNQNVQNNFQWNQNQQAMQQQQIAADQLINHHPHIIKTFGYRTNFTHQNQSYHVMLLEFCPNGSLQNCMDTFKEIFNPFSCDQSYQNFLLSTTSAKQTQNQQLPSKQHSSQYNNIISAPIDSLTPQPPVVANAQSQKFDEDGRNFTTLNLKIHIQIVRFLMKQVVSAVSFIHSRGYYQGDIKLSNILLDKEFNIKLADFGNSFQNHTAPPPSNTSRISSQQQRLNLPHIAPEVQDEVYKKSSNESISNKKYNGQSSDIFSLGVIFFCLLFNQYPFNTTQGVHLKAKSMQNAWSAVQPQLNYLIHSHPSEDVYNLIDLLTQMLNDDPQMRPSIFEVEESTWMNSTEIISIPQAIRMLQIAQQQENHRSVGEKEDLNSQQQSNLYKNSIYNRQQITQQINRNSDEMIIEEEKLNQQGQSIQSNTKGKNMLEKEHQDYRLKEAQERQEKENLQRKPSMNALDKETVLQIEENISLQNSGETAD